MEACDVRNRKETSAAEETFRWLTMKGSARETKVKALQGAALNCVDHGINRFFSLRQTKRRGSALPSPPLNSFSGARLGQARVDVLALTQNAVCGAAAMASAACVAHTRRCSQADSILSRSLSPRQQNQEPPATDPPHMPPGPLGRPFPL